MKGFLLAAALLLAGCAGDAPETATVEPPRGTEWAQCPPHASRPLAVGFRSASTDEGAGRGAGIHRDGPNDFLYVFGDYTDTLREDRVTRVNSVQAGRDTEGVLHVCTRVDLATPTQVDAEPRSYAVAVRLSATDPLPEGPVRVTVNWIAGCPCSPLPRGNATALFE